MFEHIIWTDKNLNLEDWRDDLLETAEINGEDPESLSEDTLYARMIEANDRHLGDERLNLGDVVLNRPILHFAELGLWDGRHLAIRLIKSGKVSDCLQTSEDGPSTWYVDEHGEFRARIHHHDGTNLYMYLLFCYVCIYSNYKGRPLVSLCTQLNLYLCQCFLLTLFASSSFFTWSGLERPLHFVFYCLLIFFGLPRGRFADTLPLPAAFFFFCSSAAHFSIARCRASATTSGSSFLPRLPICSLSAYSKVRAFSGGTLRLGRLLFPSLS